MKIPSVLIVAAFWLTLSASAFPQSLSESDSLVKVVGQCSDGSANCLTGFVVHSNDKSSYVLTNAHLFRDRVDSLAVTHQGKQYDARFIRGDWGRDLSLLEVFTESEIPALGLSSKALSRGDSGELRGFAYGRTEHRREGKLLGFMTSSDGSPVAVFSCPSYPGESGSPLLDGNEVIAINWGSDGHTLTATPSDEIERFIRTVAPSGFCRRANCKNRF